VLRPLDIVVLVVLAEWRGRIDTQSHLAEELGVSPASLTRSLQRLDRAWLINHENNQVIGAHAEEFLVHGLRYAFPARVGGRARGVPTAHAAPPLREELAEQEAYVWPAEFGRTSGLSIPALHAIVPALAIAYPELHQWLALLDAIRVGRARERALAARHISRLLGDR
jgi:hypothetical protein